MAQHKRQTKISVYFDEETFNRVVDICNKLNISLGAFVGEAGIRRLRQEELFFNQDSIKNEVVEDNDG